MPRALTEQEDQERLQWILDAHAKNPGLTRYHFYQCGYTYKELDAWTAAGKIKFQLRKKPTWKSLGPLKKR